MTTIEFKQPTSLTDREVAHIAAKYRAFDLGSLLLLAALVVVALFTFRDYAISNDEGVQHHYGELILAYYASGLADLSVFDFQNLYLYGGLFDIVAVSLSHMSALDPYQLRHILCAFIGISGIGATAATARLIAGPRAGFIAAGTLAVCGSWYGGMFNDTKDISLATAMTGATYFLVRGSRDLPHPRRRDVIAFGLLTGAALGIKVLGLLLVVYLCAAIVLRLPRPARRDITTNLRFACTSIWRFAPALLIAYVLMIAAWPWAGLAPLNPIRGLIQFADFHYHIRTVLAGQVYEMADVPRWYVPDYLLIKLPLPTLLGSVLAAILAGVPALAGDLMPAARRRETMLVAFAALFPLICQAIGHGPAFTGLRHFLFVVPLLSILAGVAFNSLLDLLASWRGKVAAATLTAIAVWLTWYASVLFQLHPYEYIFYNQLVGGLEGASRRYVTDYWVGTMPEAVADLEAFLGRTGSTASFAGRYSVAVCGERFAFERLDHPHLQWTPDWPHADFFIAPTHMDCDRALQGDVVATIERLGVTIGVVKDRRGIRCQSSAGTGIGGNPLRRPD